MIRVHLQISICSVKGLTPGMSAAHPDNGPQGQLSGEYAAPSRGSQGAERLANHGGAKLIPGVPPALCAGGTIDYQANLP